jgi:hypothetical protein
LGSADGKALIKLKQMDFSLTQFAKRMGQPTLSTFNMWKKPFVAGCLEKKHQSIILGQTCLKQLPDGPLDRETAVEDCL